MAAPKSNGERQQEHVFSKSVRAGYIHHMRCLGTSFSVNRSPCGLFPLMPAHRPRLAHGNTVELFQGLNNVSDVIFLVSCSLLADEVHIAGGTRKGGW